MNDALGLELSSENYDSIGGIMIEKLERVPEVGDTVELDDGTRLTTVLMDKNHIERIRMELPEIKETDENEDADEDRDKEEENGDQD